jgi:methylated-DNA-[protein]-cysteine S-methyltransferase
LNPRWTLIETLWGVVGVAGEPERLWYAGYPEPDEAGAVARLHEAVGALGAFDREALSWCEGVIRAYFRAEPSELGALPLLLNGTPFQIAVWSETRRIPFGRVATYGEVALRAGFPGAHRAAGSALSRNPAGLLVPCHRVVAANGLGGYGRWMNHKRALLRLEGYEVRE